ncbi:TIGR02680 family protein [Thermomonospora umbrina]|uniref:Uncharacterized protein (TIGR02680 family) n=1 Tax=Thermomonospora umbrina TaxID=111806 RepID=A0A3D9SWF3_9ACTN|nr:TIGR02680 family protein [Thermomonospora umbrina]REE95971.1 uncharacterized protein (TIGR02680 family) [Thermomonospora umbrina]
MTSSPSLPEPASERWKPLRAGLVDVFYYDTEEFWFHDGRLLLRGNNGAGKSKVLALTVPFLLDGDLSPHRVEPDGDRQKRMEWNLLLGGRHPHPERTGYTWMEFGRRTADGDVEFRTIGCGLKAVRHRGIAKHWFFVTPQRVGVDLNLLSGTGVALTKESLQAAVEGRGRVYETKGDYQRAVDEALFGLGSHRYEAMVNLLLQLRAPQLSKKPDEKALSAALSEALPPLSNVMVTTVAEAFRGLDEQREALHTMQEAHRAAADFLVHYRAYAAIAAKRRAAEPRNAHYRYEKAQGELIEARRRHDAAWAELDEVTALITELEARETSLTAERTALRTSPEMRDAERIEQLRQDARRRDTHAATLEDDRDQRALDVEHRRSLGARAVERQEAAHQGWVTATEEARDAAGRAGVPTDHEHILAAWETDPSRARQAAATLVTRRAEALAEFDRLSADLEKARRRLEQATDRVERAEEALQDADVRIAEDTAAVGEQASALLNAWRSHLAGLTEIRISDPDGVLGDLETWTITAEGPDPATAAVTEAARAATGALARLEADAKARERVAQEDEHSLRAQIEELESGAQEAPPQPHTRDVDARADRLGAPLWRVVDFAAELDARQRAGLEAALEASGILDAWVTPDGEPADENDTFLLQGSAANGPTCRTVLRPAVDRADPQAAALGDEAVLAVLARIGLGPGDGTWVDVDGRWSNGVLSGRWRKESAAHIGEGAREAARRTRLERLRAELVTVRERLDSARSELSALAERERALAEEHRRSPRDSGLQQAQHRLAAAHRQRRAAEAAHREAAGLAVEQARHHADARTHFTEFATDLGLPTEPDDLALVRRGLQDYRAALAALWPAAEAVAHARRAHEEASEELRRAEDTLSDAVERAQEARAQADTVEQEYRALRAMAGAAVDELRRRLEEVENALAARETEERRARERERRAREESGAAKATLGSLQDELARVADERGAALDRFRAFAATGLLAVALPELEIPDPDQEWPVSPAIQLMRAVDTALADVDGSDRAWERSQRKVAEEHKLLSDVMSRQRHEVGMTLPDGVIVIDIRFQGHRREVPELAEALAQEVADRSRLLSSREREILENHLLDEVAGALHELVADAEREVATMNAELGDRPTSTGMTLRLRWLLRRKDAPEGLDRIRDLLRQTVDVWSADDRAEVGAFLQERITAEHERVPGAAWAEVLTGALDYRSWHEFTIERLQDGQWRSATGPASGGERVLAASVPLFAAASAHYKSATNPYAPRLIALDEAFAGVDDDSRAKCLGLLATFDMDVVMTSEREWGCYPQVPGLAICQLSRRDDIDAVLVTPWRWDGRDLERAPRPEPTVQAPTAPSGGLDQEGLFA